MKHRKNILLILLGLACLFLLLLIKLVIRSVKNLLSTLWINISNRPNASCLAEKFYELLLRWGRFSGLKHTVSETPREYGIRLGKRFPQIEKEIILIVHMHDEVIYGFSSPDSHQISRVKLALRIIRSPLLWFTCIKSLCFQDRFNTTTKIVPIIT